MIVKEFKMASLKCPAQVRSNLAAIMLYAEKHNWKIIGFYAATFHMILGHRGKGQQMNIYLTSLTVQTVMNHPKRGVSQLNRKGLDIFQIEEVFKNVRKHTGKGYYVKRK